MVDKPRDKERSWWPWLMAGVCVTSMSLSLVCLAHLLIVQHHSCECKPVRNGPYTPQKPIGPTAQELDKTQKLESENIDKSITNPKRIRRQVIGANNLYQLQTQIMMIETRLRLMQDEIKRSRTVTGRRGPSGPPGRPGSNGMEGRPGNDGPMGIPGRDGKDGKDGLPGPPGAPGPPGVNGLQGPRGERGLKGIRGAMGDKGEQGLPGPKGNRGPSGRNGESGEPGNPGTAGKRGQKGEAGSTTCYVTQSGKRVQKDCYLAAQDPPDASNQGKRHAGVIFERWGRTACPVGTRSIYSGQAASAKHGRKRTGGSNYMCVPSKPWYFGQRSPNEPLRNVSRPRIGIQDETGLQASLYYIPCAVCLARLRSISVMIPARKECSRGWHREYDGFLAVQVNRGDNKELMCVDREARGIFATPNYVQPLHADCNTFSCPPYTDRERLPCVVCSM